MTITKCYVNQIGDNFTECVKGVMEEVRNAKRRKSVTIIFDGIPLIVDKKTSYKELLHKHMIQSSKTYGK